MLRIRLQMQSPPPKVFPFAASLCIHAGLIAAMIAVDNLELATNPARKRVYELTILPPPEKKVIWYSFPKKELPSVAPRRRIGNSPTPRSQLQSVQQSIIAMPPNAMPGEQLIWQPAPRVQIEQNLQVPNLIAFASAGTLPSRPPAPKAKAFVPPVRQTPKPVDVSLASAPRIELQTTSVPKLLVPTGAGGTEFAPKPAPRKFVPPTGAQPGPSSRAPVLIEDSAPALQAGNGSVTAAIVSLDPANRLEQMLPDGTRATQFSRAPALGAPASGSTDHPVAGHIPNVAIGEPARPSARAVAKPPERANPVEILVPLTNRTLSAPLRPSSRTLPGIIEARFRSRDVYAAIVSLPNLPAYGGDWILWFAEREPKPGNAPVMIAPAPARKLQPPQSSMQGAGKDTSRVETRIQLTAIIDQKGRVSSVSVLKGSGPGVNQAVAEDFETWEFRPATRHGLPVDVEVVFEIPYRLPAELARQ